MWKETFRTLQKSSRRKTKDSRSFLLLPLFSDLSHHRTCRSAYGGSLHSVQLNIVVQQAGVASTAQFIVPCGLVHYAFRIGPISFTTVPIDLCPVRMPHLIRFSTRVCGRFHAFQIHIRMRLRSHWSIASSADFISASLKYPTQPRIVSRSTCLRRSYPIPLLRPVSSFSFAFSLAMLLGCVLRSLQPSPVL